MNVWQLYNYSGPVEAIQQCQGVGHIDGSDRTVTHKLNEQSSGKIKCANCDLWRDMTLEEAVEVERRYREESRWT